MSVIFILALVNLFCAGVLAGMEIAFHYGLRAPAEVLGEQPQIRLRQALILRLRVLVPAFFVPMALSGIAVTVLDRAAPGFGFRVAGMFAVLIWIVVRVVGTIRINEATLAWRPEEPPTNWLALISESERFHLVGTWAAVVAFAFFLAALALRVA